MRDVPRSRQRRKQRRRRRLYVLLPIVIVFIALIAAAGWIGSRALAAKDSLDAAQSKISELRSTALDDPAGAPALVASVQKDTAHARELTSDWVWRGGEIIPVVGGNLTAVRQLAAAVDDVSTGALGPIASVASTLDIEALKPVDGRINLAPISAAVDSVAVADAAVKGALADVQAIDTAGTVGQVSDAKDQLDALLTEAAALTDVAHNVTQLVPGMLGATEPRQYLLAFQNNAEARSLGGNAASLLLLSVDNGAISIAAQAGSTEFPANQAPPVAIDQGVTQLYYPLFPRYIQDIATRPDFPSMALLAQGYWEAKFGQHVDSVISFDPIALGYLLDATGPITLATGDVLNTDNAVPLLLSDVYSRYPDPADQDIFFAAAARSVFDSLTGGAPDPKRLLTALTKSVDQGSLMVWSERSEEQALIQPTALSGALAATNEEKTEIGVYFEDLSSSKIDYWVDSSVTVSSDQCSTDGAAAFSTTFSLSSRLTSDRADSLPAYVLPGFFDDRLRTDIYVIGPVGATLRDITTDVPGASNAILSTGSDGGRPVVRLSTDILTVSGATTMTVRFTGEADTEYGPVDVRTTPMVNPTTVTIDAPGCATSQ